ncbi:uncharacterized protein [Misgurnus anguillicaudatus]|uniref:uncharacterized protein n=1 Tax=Misgurnus anguillicaudatus TaxID=75329 RepID=UPI003CCF538C
MAGFWTNQKEEELVDLWEERPELYAVGVAIYTNRNARGNEFRSIATALGVSEAEVKKKIENMRTQYNRYLKSPPSGSGGNHTPRQEWFLRRLKFLELHMRKRPSTSNLDVHNDSSTTSTEEGESEDRGEDRVEDKEDEEQDKEEEEEEEEAIPPSGLQKKRRKRQPDPAQAQDLVILGAINETLKVLTENHQHNLQPPKNDSIHAFCQFMEQQLRAIDDPHHLQYIQFQIHQILFSPRPPSSQYAPTYLHPL